jgi:hypothetical protein
MMWIFLAKSLNYEHLGGAVSSPATTWIDHNATAMAVCWRVESSVELGLRSALAPLMLFEDFN